MYDPEKKKRSCMKHVMNRFISFLKPSRALVIDASTLLSSSALLKAGLAAAKIVVVNDDERTIERAKAKGHCYSRCGTSTEVLPYIDGRFEVIYFDYCGLPERRSDGFDPEMDLEWACSRLKRGGIVIVTFSRRTACAFEKALGLIPNQLSLQKTIFYHESSSMMSMIMSKGVLSFDIEALFDSARRSTKPRPLKGPGVSRMTLRQTTLRQTTLRQTTLRQTTLRRKKRRR